MALMYDTDAGCGSEFGPVCCFRQPVQIISDLVENKFSSIIYWKLGCLKMNFNTQFELEV